MLKKAYRDRTFHSLIRRALLLPIILLGCLAVLLLKQTAQLSALSAQMGETGEAVDSVRQVQGLMLDMETGMRGYLLEGDPAFLQPYNLAKPKLKPALLALKQLTETHSQQPYKVQELENQINIWSDYTDRKIAMREIFIGPSLLFLDNDSKGKSLVDSLRGQIGKILEEEKVLMEEQTSSFKSLQRNIIFSISLGTLILAFIMGIFSRNQLAFLSKRYEKALNSEEDRSKQLQIAQSSAESSSKEVVAILEGMQDGFLETDGEWTIVRVNRSQELSSKTDRTSMLGKNLWDLFPEPAERSSKHWTYFNLVMEIGESQQFEEFYQPTMTWHEYAVYPRLGGGISIFSRDITQRKKAEESLSEQIVSLESERAIREIFVSTLSHDLRNPLGIIQMSSNIMLDERGMEEREKIDLASMIFNASQRANRMIENLLDANRIKSGESLPLHIEKQDLRTIAINTMADLSLLHGDRFALNIPDNDMRGYWSGEGVRRMLENLCTNAVKYGDCKRPVTVILSGLPRSVKVSVHNLGNPLSSEDQRLIFEPFQRSHSAQESGQQGWGLGLTLVRGLAEAHGGSVGVESSEGEGTTFTICLPRDSRQLSFNLDEPFHRLQQFA